MPCLCFVLFCVFSALSRLVANVCYVLFLQLPFAQRSKAAQPATPPRLPAPTTPKSEKVPKNNKSRYSKRQQEQQQQQLLLWLLKCFNFLSPLFICMRLCVCECIFSALKYECICISAWFFSPPIFVVRHSHWHIRRTKCVVFRFCFGANYSA